MLAAPLLLLLLLLRSWRLATRIMCHAVKSNPMSRDSRLAGLARQDCTQLSTIPQRSAGLETCFLWHCGRNNQVMWSFVADD
ncbi:uncharacterized protein K444DRAFT_611144 [Hyaloscypha bicolor E]|uniref:Secreted protein n=1 Tax=Hyaloscypha bicolor E TaxID=1095630 RepID=A0A2J6TFX4_9HELO|nr:uncharacterized protein K444DRAFT_611144 [Hyaloscypha bicolor E]PMD61927.1 hypothetical protein K444DRAFT_611144 [Hyaloscypha bicolor E]